MALNPKGTRQRSGGATDLRQFIKEYRLFDGSSLSAISPVISVTNEPVVINITNIAAGQAVAVDMVSDYDGTPSYQPFTPTRGTPLILDEGLTSVILFYSGRYVLRLTGTGLGVINAFAYPFSVSHDWADYYASLGTGGDVVRSLDEIDTSSINITLNPDPGVGVVTIRADVIVSPNDNNIFQVLASGCFAQGPDNGNILVVPTSVLDTTSIDLTLAANVLSAVVIRSPFVGQVLQLRADGVYVPGPQLGDPTAVPTSVLDTQSIDLVLATNVLSANAIISPDAGNSLAIRANGLYSIGFAGTISSAADTATIDHNVAVGVLTSNVIRSPDLGNLLELRANGVYTGLGTAITSVIDTLSIDHTLASNVLQSDLRIDPSVENALNLGAAGVLVEQATTAELEAENAGDLVVNAITLGHIVNARTVSRSTHVGITAGGVLTDQVAVGFQAGGGGATGTRQVALGSFAGSGNTGTENIAIGYNAGVNVTGANNILIGPNASTGIAKSLNVIIDPYGITATSAHNDQCVIIGPSAFTNVTNGGSAYAAVLGGGACSSTNLLNMGSVTAVGSGALANFTQVTSGGSNNQPPVAIGFSAGQFARSNDFLGFGQQAGSYFSALKTTADQIIAIGNQAGFSAFNEVNVASEENKNVILIGPYAGYNVLTYKGSTVTPGDAPAGEAPAWTVLLTGYNTGYYAELLETVGYGTAVFQESGVKCTIGLGEFSGWHSSFTNSVLVGRRTGLGNTGTNCTFVGADAGYGATNFVTNYTPAFTNAAINVATNIITTGAHGLTVGNYVSAMFNVVAGVPPTVLSEVSNQYVFFVVSPTTVRTITRLADAGVGTFRLSLPILQFDNATALGYSALATASNQVTLGNGSTSTVRTSGKIQPGTYGGGSASYQTAVGLSACTGAPNNADGSNGDIMFRSDGGAMTTIYQKRAGAWVGIV